MEEGINHGWGQRDRCVSTWRGFRKTRKECREMQEVVVDSGKLRFKTLRRRASKKGEGGAHGRWVVCWGKPQI